MKDRDGNWHFEAKAVRGMVWDFCVDLYNDSQPCSHNYDLERGMFPSFSPEEFKHLSDPFIQDDVK